MAGKACFLSFNLEVFPPKVAHFSIWPGGRALDQSQGQEHSPNARVTRRNSKVYRKGRESVSAAVNCHMTVNGAVNYHTTVNGTVNYHTTVNGAVNCHMTADERYERRDC